MSTAATSRARRAFAVLFVILMVASIAAAPVCGKEDMIIGSNLVEGDPGDGHDFSGGGGGLIDNSESAGSASDLPSAQPSRYPIPVLTVNGTWLFLDIDRTDLIRLTYGRFFPITVLERGTR